MGHFGAAQGTLGLSIEHSGAVNSYSLYTPPSLWPSTHLNNHNSPSTMTWGPKDNATVNSYILQNKSDSAQRAAFVLTTIFEGKYTYAEILPHVVRWRDYYELSWE